MSHDTTLRYSRQARNEVAQREWADDAVMVAFLRPPPAEACTDIGADQPRALTVSPLRRLIRSLRIRIITRSPL